MAFVLIFLITAIVLLITRWYVKLFNCNKYLGKYPGPRPLPLIGNIHSFGSAADILPVFQEYLYKFGPITKLMLADRPRLIVADPRAAEFLLGSNTILEKSYEYKYLHSWLGTGLLTSSSEKWKRQRKLITPTFHFQILEQFLETYDSQSNVLVEKLNQEVDGPSFDLCPYVTHCTLDIICEAAMGTSVNAQNDSDSEYVRSVKEMCRILIVRTFSPFKMWDFLYKFSNDYLSERKALGVLHGYTNYVITKRRDELTSNSESKTTSEDDTGIKRRLAFLDLLLQANINGEPLTNEEIREEVDTFMFEGHDTTSSGIAFILYCLSQNPTVQEKVSQELRNIFADDKTKSPSYKDFQEMKYLEMVIKESLRMYPPVPLYARILQQDVEYDGDVWPKGLSVTVNAFGLHRNKELYLDPEKFDPERFSPENLVGRSPFMYLPFSAGPRNCIGQRFAMLEMKSTVSKVLRNFELLPVAEHKPILESEAVLKSANGLRVFLKKRNDY